MPEKPNGPIDPSDLNPIKEEKAINPTNLPPVDGEALGNAIEDTFVANKEASEKRKALEAAQLENTTVPEPAKETPANPENEKAGRIEEKINLSLQEQVDKLNSKIDQHKFPKTLFDKFRRNSSARMAAGFAISITSAYGGSFVHGGALAARTAISALGIGTVNQERRMKEQGKVFDSLSGAKEGENYNTEKAVGIFKTLDKDKQMEIMATFLEHADRRAQKISTTLLEKEKAAEKEAAEKHSLVTDKYNELLDKFHNLKGWQKLAIMAGTTVLSIGSGIVIGGAAGIAVSGAIGLASGSLMSSREKIRSTVSESTLIEALTKEYENNSELAFDPEKFNQTKERISKQIKGSTIRGAALGAALPLLVAGFREVFGHGHTADQAEHPSSAKVNVVAEGHGQQPAEENISDAQTTPEHGLHLKSEYLENKSNIGLNADKHLAEVELRGQLDGMGKHFANHAEFEVARDRLVTEWHTTHPDLFNSDGSIKPEHIHDIASTLHFADAKNILETSGAALVADSAIEPHVGQHSGAEAAAHSDRMTTPQETESVAREHLNQAAGAKVPPTWHTGHNFEAYNSGKSITESGIMDSLKDKQISKDSLNYLNALSRSGTLRPEDIHVSADGKHLIMNLPNSAAKDIVWTTEIKDRSIFSRLFPGRTADIKEIFPHSHVDAKVEPTNMNHPENTQSATVNHSNAPVGQPASSAGEPDQSVIVHEKTDMPHPNGPVSQSGEVHVTGEQANEALQKVQEIQFKDIPKNVLENMSKAHPDWNDAQKLESYRGFVKLQEMQQAGQQNQ